MKFYKFQMLFNFFWQRTMKKLSHFFAYLWERIYYFVFYEKMRRKITISFWSCFVIASVYFAWIFLSLPRLLSMEDYKPPLLTEVYDRHDQKVGEFFKQRRLLFEYEDMPKHIISAFVAAEDGHFFEHKGLNYKAIARAFLANIKARRKVQGGSTITQQVARTLLLTSKKTYTRKFKEAILALRMENALSKQDILYIYLNQIYLGHGSYGVEMASKIYFRKSIKEITIAEAALLAGLPKAPSRFSPIFYPERAKKRQIYVLNRMKEEEFITQEEFKKYLAEPIQVYVREDFNSKGPYYLETVRQLLLLHLDSKDILESGLKIYTAIDLEKQKHAQLALRKGLEELDQRQGFRGVKRHISNKEEKARFIQQMDRSLKKELRAYLTIPGFEFDLLEQGKFSRDSFEILSENIKQAKEEIFDLKDKQDLLVGKIFSALVSKIHPDKIEILTPFGLKHLYLKKFAWAVPVEKKEEQGRLKHPEEIFKVNDVISVKVQKNPRSKKQEKNNMIHLSLYQEPFAEAALLSFDLETSEIIALVGGYSFSRSQFNRAYQSKRQPGSAFKPFVYASALERGFTPASVISDTPVVFSNDEAEEKVKQVLIPEEVNMVGETEENEEGEEEEVWKPSNISQRFLGNILFRTALIRSLNVPTVKVIEKIGLDWVRFYVRRLGLFSPLNSDFTMALGSSGLTVYEMLKAFSVFPRGGKRIRPLVVHRVEDRDGEVILRDISLDELFQNKIEEAEEFVEAEKERWFGGKTMSPERKEIWAEIFESEDQLIPEGNSYIVNNLLESVVFDPEGTGRRARVLERPVAGKTGTTNGYYDAWFTGYSPFISTGVWVGFDKENTLGRGETGSRSALPIWIDYMKGAHEELPEKGFSVPEKIIFVNIDKDTGGLVSSRTKSPARQAFIEGTEPQIFKNNEADDFKNEESFMSDTEEDESDFIKGNLSR